MGLGYVALDAGDIALAKEYFAQIVPASGLVRSPEREERMALAQALEAFAHLAGFRGILSGRRACSVPPRYSGNTAASCFPPCAGIRCALSRRFALHALESFGNGLADVLPYFEAAVAYALSGRMRIKPILYVILP